MGELKSRYLGFGGKEAFIRETYYFDIKISSDNESF